MRGSNRLGRSLAAVAVAATSLGALAQPAAAGPTPPDVPTDIAVPDGNKVFLVGHAVGSQDYRCDPVSGGFAWQFVGPTADLYDDHGNRIVTHFGGPSWQAADGSTVIGKRDAGVNMDRTAIDWLRVSISSRTVGEDGDRLFGTTFIQRVATTGGLIPPAAECNADTVGDVDNVPYTADYYFWKATGG